MNKRRLVAMGLAAVMTASMIGCGGGDSASSKSKEDSSTSTSNESASSTSTASKSTAEGEEVVVTMPTYRSGEDVGAVFFLPQVERFNEKYKGKYKIVIEESPSNTHTERIKQLALQDDLPAIFQCSDSKWVKDYLIANGKLQDLSEFIDSKTELKDLLIKDSVDFCTAEDGGVYAMPLTVLKPTGLYYNSALFNPDKPITEMSWEEFSEALGDNKIAYQTAEGGWTINLMLTGILGTLDGGAELLQKGVLDEKLTDFTDPVMVEAFTILQDSFKKNGSENAIGAVYADAANTFYANMTAVLPDGTWIIDKVNDPTDWANGFDGANVVGDYYPGNVAIANPYVYDWMVPAGLPEEELELAYAFLEFINTPEEIEAFILAEGGSAPNLAYSDSFQTEMSKNKLLNDFATKANEETVYVPYFNNAISESLFTGEFTNLMTGLYNGSTTPEEFCEQLTEAAKQ